MRATFRPMKTRWSYETDADEFAALSISRDDDSVVIAANDGKYIAEFYCEPRVARAIAVALRLYAQELEPDGGA